MSVDGDILSSPICKNNCHKNIYAIELRFETYRLLDVDNDAALRVALGGSKDSLVCVL